MKTPTCLTRKVLAIAIASALSPSTMATDYTWIGGSGNWADAAMWGAAAFPNAATDNAFIDGGKAATASFATVAGTINVGNVTVDLGDTLRIANGALLNVYGNLSNNGQVELLGGTAVVRVADGTTFAGGGTLTMGGDGLNFIQSIFGQPGNRLTNAAGHTIEGAGNIGSNNMKLTNQGLIVANNANALLIDPIDDPDGVINSGTLRARDSARLVLGQGIYTNTGATIEALDASFVDLAGRATILGGTLSTAGSGLIRIQGAVENTLTDVTLAGRLQVQSGSLLHVTGALTNNGQVELVGGTAVVRVADGTTFAGGGTLTMGGDGLNFIQSIFGQPGNRLTNAAGHTIEGAGNIGSNNMKLTNQGLIVANNANALVLDPIDTPDGFYNRGTIRVDATRVMTFAPGSTLVQDSGSARSEVNGTLNVPLLDLQAGVLTGTGVVAGPVQNIAGIVAPGASPGTLTVGSFLQSAMGTLAVELENLGSHDLLLVNGTASLGGTLALSCFGACSFAVGDEFVILDSTGNLSGTFAGSPTLTGFGTGAFEVVYDYTLDEVRLKIIQDVTPVPEPGTWALMLAGLGLVVFGVRRRS